MALWQYHNNKWNKSFLRNSHEGKTAFVVCNGPSFNDIDVTKLKGPGRVVIGVNNTYPTLIPDFWVGMDTPDCYDVGVFAENFPKVVRGTMTKEKYAGKDLMYVPNVYFADVATDKKFWDEPKNDCFEWHNHTLSIALQLALFLGCKDIVLMGVDLDNSVQHYADGNYLTPSLAARNQLLHDQQYDFLKELSEEAREHSVTFYASSQRSRLKEFLTVVDPAEVIANLENTIVKGRVKKHVLEGQAECNEFKAYLERGRKPYSLGHQAMYKAPIELIRGIPADILEVGFGIGVGIEMLLEANCVSSYVGCEPCPDSYEFTKDKINDPKVTLLNTPWQKLMTKKVDFSFMIEVIEHIPKEEWAQLLLALKGATKKALFLSTPDSRDTTHGVITTEELTTLLKEAGFNVTYIRHQWTTMYICTPND